MAKDYFQDILPPSDGAKKRPVQAAAEMPADESEERSVPIRTFSDDHPHVDDDMPQQDEAPQRSIRNISMPMKSRTSRPMPDMRETPPVERGRSRWWLWIIAVLAVVVLGVLVLVAFRATTVTVTPRSHTLTFDDTSTFTAYPVATAATGTLTYSVQTADFEDSEVVKSTGTVHAEDKASGEITIYNNYQTTPLHFVKTTRFESADGHIFRTPADVVIPGKSGSTPGQVTVTVIADKAGEDYNVAAGKFTVPGLKSNATEYAQVYAQSTAAMSGGFVGDKPGVSDADQATALSTIKGRLQDKAQAAASSTDGTLVFPQLMTISYSDEPSTTEAGGSVRIHEKAHVEIPQLSSDAFANLVAADVAGSPVTLRPGSGFGASLKNATSTTRGTDPIQFPLTGSATIVWNIDTTSLATALAGKEQSAFQAIVTQFPGIEEAHARIEPFWKGSFPTDPKKIKIVVQEPQS
ncbi:MAG TPA: hypothetical protein VHD38_03185 [Candidatus Paceibacterota bacterium]|nr:hypothetical protein [Candidatus Paceibacterota bacterium]